MAPLTAIQTYYHQQMKTAVTLLLPSIVIDLVEPQPLPSPAQYEYKQPPQEEQLALTVTTVPSA